MPLSKQIIYSIGQLGWSTLVNLISLTLVYFYIPPEEAGIPFFITQITFLGVLNLITIIAASGRLFDAITDPVIAYLSDNFDSKFGRRIPFLAVGALPAGLFCILLFIPPVSGVSNLNIAWVAGIQILFYLFLTVYVTPYFALLPELAKDEEQRLDLSTYISITFALGMIIASQLPAIANLLESAFALQRVQSFQAAIFIIVALAVLLMYLPVIFIDENKYCNNQPAKVNIKEAFKTVASNQNFRYYVIADFAYFTGITLINTGLLYYVTVLLLQGEALVGILMPLMVIVSFAFYPLVNILAKKFGKKILVLLSFLMMAVVFGYVYFLGRLPLSNQVQGYILAVLAAMPMAFLGILPNAILADIAELDAVQTGDRKEGAFFAGRTLLQKFGQSAGVFIFAALTTFGNSPGNDTGIRLSGLVGMTLCLIAAAVFKNYKEEKILEQI